MTGRTTCKGRNLCPQLLSDGRPDKVSASMRPVPATPANGCCTTVWLVFSNTTRMRCWVLPGSVQLQDYYIHPEKMGASRKDLADAIQSYSDNDSQKNGELFISRYRKLFLPQTCPDIQMYPEP